ncbi:MAG: hypothetical protein DRG63_03235 [Deltaproteobacteria bacterium]|nr:MAG: hypothetical protein DRG63_03235 [Deltaproteobacteria bacterium]
MSQGTLDRNMKLARLKDEELEALQELERRLGDICLIAVEKTEAFYVLEAKVGPNTWKPVDEVYTEIEGLRSYYFDEDSARLSKGALKSLLASTDSLKRIKRPIRIRKIKE